jgi:phosphoribosylformylglycinamidine cyclo-ligase
MEVISFSRKIYYKKIASHEFFYKITRNDNDITHNLLKKRGNMKQKESGINIKLGDSCSKIAFDWAKKTFANRNEKFGSCDTKLDGAFSNIIYFDKLRLGIASDGIGTKIELAERTQIYNTLGYDLIAMVADDLAANGFEPTNLSNILDVDFLDEKIVDELMKGLHDAAKMAKIAVTGGEIAELGKRIGGYGENMHFNWCSTAIGYLPEKLEKPINGSEMETGDVIISLKSRGFRSNGYSLIRKIMEENFGSEWHQEKYDETQTWGEVLLCPCLIFAPLIHELVRKDFHVTGIAHITGGGIAENFARVLKVKKLGAKLHNIYEPLPFMLKVQESGNVPEEKAYQIWNMGNAMLLTVKSSEADAVLESIKLQGFEAKIAGKITEKTMIELQTKGLFPQKIQKEIG